MCVGDVLMLLRLRMVGARLLRRRSAAALALRTASSSSDLPLIGCALATRYAYRRPSCEVAIYLHVSACTAKLHPKTRLPVP